MEHTPESAAEENQTPHVDDTRPTLEQLIEWAPFPLTVEVQAGARYGLPVPFAYVVFNGNRKAIAWHRDHFRAQDFAGNANFAFDLFKKANQ